MSLTEFLDGINLILDSRLLIMQSYSLFSRKIQCGLPASLYPINTVYSMYMLWVI